MIPATPPFRLSTANLIYLRNIFERLIVSGYVMVVTSRIKFVRRHDRGKVLFGAKQSFQPIGS